MTDPATCPHPAGRRKVLWLERVRLAPSSTPPWVAVPVKTDAYPPPGEPRAAWVCRACGRVLSRWVDGWWLPEE